MILLKYRDKYRPNTFEIETDDEFRVFTAIVKDQNGKTIATRFFKKARHKDLDERHSKMLLARNYFINGKLLSHLVLDKCNKKSIRQWLPKWISIY